MITIKHNCDSPLRIKEDNIGVSPVVGVILMVAITVVLAAVVFVLVNNLSDNVSDTPIALGIRSYDNGTYIITSVSDNSIFYDSLIIKDDGSVLNYTINNQQIVDGQVVEAGDVIRLEDLVDGKHEVTFIYENQLVYTDSFTV